MRYAIDSNNFKHKLNKNGIVRLSSIIANNSETAADTPKRTNKITLEGNPSQIEGSIRDKAAKRTIPLTRPHPVVPARLLDPINLLELIRDPRIPAAGSPKVTAKIAREHKFRG